MMQLIQLCRVRIQEISMVELHYVMMCGHIREVVECTKQVSCMAQQNLSHQKKLQDASQPLEISLDQHGDIWMTIIHSLFPQLERKSPI